MPCPLYFIRVPAAPHVVQEGGPGLGSAVRCSWHAAARCRGMWPWLKYSACMSVVPRDGKDREEAGWRQDTSLLPCCKTLPQRDSHLSREQASQRCPCQRRLLTTPVSPVVPLQQRAGGAPQPVVGLPAGGVSPGPRTEAGSISGTRAPAGKGGWSQAE